MTYLKLLKLEFSRFAPVLYSLFPIFIHVVELNLFCSFYRSQVTRSMLQAIRGEQEVDWRKQHILFTFTLKVIWWF